MRLAALTLERYGVFERTTLALDPSPGRVNLIVAPNGAGKSVMVDAFCDLLFGIHKDSEMKFRFDDYAGMRLRAEAVVDGAAVTLVRRKGNRNTLTDGEGTPVDPATLRRWLGSVADRDRLQRLFALDSHRLRAAEGLLLNSEGDLAEALLSGTGDLHSARELRGQLEARRDAIGKPGGRGEKRPLNKALGDWDEAGAKLRAATRTPEQRDAQERQHQQAEAERQSAEALRAEAQRQLGRLGRLQVTQPAASLRQAALDALTALPGTPLLDPALLPQLDKAATEAVRTRDRLDILARQAGEAAGQVTRHDVPGRLLAASEAIEAIANDTKRIRDALAESPALQHGRDAAWSRARLLLAQLGLKTPPEQAERTLPAPTVVQAAQAAAAQHEAARQEAAKAADKALRSGAAAAESGKALAGCEDKALPPGLEKLLGAIRQDGAPDSRRAAAELDLDGAEAARTACLDRLGAWRGRLNDLLALALPDMRALERLHGAMQDAADAVHAAEAALSKLTVQRCQADDALADMTAAAPPDEAALAKARARRDEGWRLVRVRAFGPGAGAEAEAAFAPAPLDQAFQSAMEQADAVADRRFAAATHLASIGEAVRRLERAERDRGAAADALDAAQDACAEATDAWRTAIGPFALPQAAGLGELRDFLSAREAVVEAHAHAGAACRVRNRLAVQHEEWASQLAAAMAARASGLAALLAEADARVAESHDGAVSRATLQERAETDARLHREAWADQARSEGELARRREEWAGHLRALGRPEGEPPEVALGHLTLFEAVREECREAARLDERVSDIALAADRFLHQVRTALSACGRPASSDLFADAAAMAAALREGQRAADLAAKDRETARKHDAERAKQQEADVEARSALRAVLALCGAGDVDAARTRLEHSAARSRLLAQVATAEETLLKAGAGLSLQAVLAEAASVAPDELPGLQQAADAAVTEQSGQAATAAVRANDLRRQLGQDEAAGEVITAAGAQAAALATVERTAEETLVLHVALAMLDRGLKLVEEAGGDAGLARIAQIFGRLTNGAYRAVEAADRNGAARLRVVDAAWPNEQKTMSQLSEGTRDQLCLALRLAAIEDHVKAAPALPFIGDDILQTFDDERALATLRALADASRQVQVIVLSHHRHLLGVASKLGNVVHPVIL